ncbi:MAG: hypothetical protein ACJ78H_12850 [Chloroflexota bacterium]
MSRRFGALVLAILAATGLVASPAGLTDVAAAEPGLSIVTDARYDVQPEDHRVRVTVDLAMKNRLSDTSTKRFYFDHALLAVQPGASAPKLTCEGSGTPKASVSKSSKTSTILRLDLGARLYSGKNTDCRLVFDMVDEGGAAGRQVRVGDSLAAFPVWAFASGSTPGSTVRVDFPAGYTVDVAAGDMPAPTTAADGTVSLKTGALKTPLTFFAYLVGDRAAATTDRQVEATVGGAAVPLTISAWADDKAWGERVGDLASRALPVLSERIGQGWPRTGGLDIHESVGRASGGYAGLFDPAAGRIDVAYDARDEVVLHEAAHAWFDGSLLADRWATEGFASYYARAVAPDLGVSTSPDTEADTIPTDLEKARIPLNAWGKLGSEPRPTEDFAYAASLVLARAIAERVGDDGLKAVWADAAAKTGAYQPPAGSGEPEKVDAPPDWRGLLDLFDEHATTPVDDLWRTWVARPEDLALLDAREAARTHYDAVLASAGGWQLPRQVRDAMRAWQFDDAERLLTEADTILEETRKLASEAEAAGLTLPDTLPSAFEGPDGLTAARAEIDDTREAISHYTAAVDARPPTMDLVTEIGLWGASPDADLDAASSEFASGDPGAATTSADLAASTWSNAADVGRDRLLGIGLLILGVFLAGLVAAVLYRSRRRRRSAAVTEVDTGA